MPFAHNNNLSIYYDITGQGPTLAICGGLGDSWRNWQLLIQKLALDFRVLYVQNRGAGQSARPTQTYTIADMADDVVCVLNQENISKTHLMGFSLGGRIAQSFAVRHPQRLDKLILVSTAPDWQKSHPAHQKVRDAVLGFQGIESDFSQLFALLYGKKYRSKISERAFAKFRNSDPYPQTLADYQLQLNAVSSFDAQNDLTKIISPTLILAGAEDALTPPQNAEMMQTKIHNAQTRIYPETGHLLPYEKTADFLQDIRKFLLE